MQQSASMAPEMQLDSQKTVMPTDSVKVLSMLKDMLAMWGIAL